MKLASTCFKCMEEAGNAYIPRMVRLVPKHSGLYRFVCSKGHEGAVVLQERHFQLLFEIGLHALNDGYPREAVADFTASLERFFEFYTKFVFRLQGIGQEAIRLTWRHMAAQSERQLGSYVAAYVMHQKTVAPVLSSESVSFRNNVTHKGHIPSQKEALAFGEAVKAIVQPILETLAERHPEELQSDTFAHIAAQNPNWEHAATMSYPTTLSFNPNTPKCTLEERLAVIRLPPWS